MNHKNPNAGDVPTISIIVPLYNAASWIGRCLNALRLQDTPADRVEILMVDNNSTDAGPRLVRESALPNLRLLSERAQGAYHARNRAVAEARGELLIFLDPDCVPEPDWLRQLLSALADPATQLVVGRVDQGTGDSLALRLLSAYDDRKLAHALASSDVALYSGQTGNMAVRAEVFDRLGPFHTDARGGDTLLVIDAARTFGCAAVRYAPAARVRHIEVATLRALLRKHYLYGRARGRHAGADARRPFSRATRRELARQATAGERFPRLARLALYALAALTAIAFRAGAFAAGRASHARRPGVRPATRPAATRARAEAP